MEVLHVINLSKRQDRVLSVINQSKLYEIPIMFWEGIELELPYNETSSPARNINKAHKQIVQWARDNGHKTVNIAEDDFIMSVPGSWQYFLNKKNELVDWDLFLGMVYSAEINEDRIVNGFSGLTLYSVHEIFYDFFLSIPDHVHIDRFLGMKAFEHKYLICQPYVALQSGGISDNLKREMHYEVYTDSMNFYGRENEKFYRGQWIPKGVPI